MKRILIRYALIGIWLTVELFLFQASSSVPPGRGKITASAAEGDRFYILSDRSLASVSQEGKILWEDGFDGKPLSVQIFRQEVLVLTTSFLYSFSQDGSVNDSTGTDGKFTCFCRIDQYYVFYDAIIKKVIFSHFPDGSNPEFSYRTGEVRYLGRFNSRNAAVLTDSGIFIAGAEGIEGIEAGFIPDAARSSKEHLLLKKGSDMFLWSGNKQLRKMETEIDEAAAFDYPYIFTYDSVINAMRVDE